MKKLIPKKLYNQIVQNVPIACVDIAIKYNGAILLVKRADPPAEGQWWLPGGRIVKGEMMRETAIRKARDEVGIDCRVGPIIYTAETLFPDGPDNTPIHSINNCFLMYPCVKEPSIKLDNHHQGYRWVEKIPNGLNSYVVKCLARAGLEEPMK